MSARLVVVALLSLGAGGLLAQSVPIVPYPGMYVAEMDAGRVTTSLQHNDPAAFGRVFGTWQVGGSLPPVTIRVGNYALAGASQPLTLPVMASGGADFVLDTSGFVTTGLGPNTFTEFTVAFAPQSTGARAGVIEFQYEADPYYNPGVLSTFAINVSGFGSATPVARVRITEDTAAGPRVYENQTATGSRAFGPRVTTSGAAMRTYVIANSGGAGAPVLTLGLPTLTSGGPEFAVDTAGFAASLAAGASTSFSVAFDPSSLANYTALVEFTHSDSSETSPFRVNFSGYGADVAAVARVSDQPGPHFQGPPSPGSWPPPYSGASLLENAPAAGARDLGAVALGSDKALTMTVSHAASGYMDITYTYYASADLTLGTPTISGDPDFTLEAASFATSISEGTSSSFAIRFTPSSLGLKTATVSFTHGDGSERSPFRINVQAAGVPMAGTGPGQGQAGGACSAGEGDWMFSFAPVLALAVALRRRRSQLRVD